MKADMPEKDQNGDMKDLREQLEDFGGQLSIKSRPGGGTEAAVVV